MCRLLQSGKEPEKRDEDGRAPLHIAVLYNQVKAVPWQGLWPLSCELYADVPPHALMHHTRHGMFFMV